MLHYLLFLTQLALITLYDWVFFSNAYAAYSASRWWVFAFVHAALLAEFVSMWFLRHMNEMPLSKKHPMWLFTIMVVIQLFLAVIFSLVTIIPLKWVIILSAAVFGAHLLSFVVLLLVQKHRERKERCDYGDEPDFEEDEPELPPPPQKFKSSAMLLLMKFLADPNSWDVPADFKEIDALTEAASSATQYTYEELSQTEAELKDQVNALKAYIRNGSINRAKNSVYMILDILEEREAQIIEIEK